MTRKIITTLDVEGLHRWKDCGLPDVMYLRNSHRHIFHIECEKTVTSDDREIEIITFKHQIQNYLVEKYGKFDHVMDFGGMSCEMIAEELFSVFGLCRCRVLEDGENGAEVSA